jgi:VPDSG-CTERM motif
MAHQMKKLIILTAAVGGLACAALYADPSANGLEHRNSDFNPTRAGWSKDCTPVPVPDAGGTLGLLSLGVAGLAFWRLKLA